MREDWYIWKDPLTEEPNNWESFSEKRCMGNYVGMGIQDSTGHSFTEIGDLNWQESFVWRPFTDS